MGITFSSTNPRVVLKVPHSSIATNLFIAELDQISGVVRKVKLSLPSVLVFSYYAYFAYFGSYYKGGSCFEHAQVKFYKVVFSSEFQNVLWTENQSQNLM